LTEKTTGKTHKKTNSATKTLQNFYFQKRFGKIVFARYSFPFLLDLKRLFID